MDTSLSFFSLSFGDSDTPEISYNVKNVITSQDSVDNDLNQPSRPPSVLLQADDVLEELLSTAGAQHIDENALNGVQTLYCEICGKSFDKIMKYYGHLRVHSKDNLWLCDKCPSIKFSTKQQLQKHALEHYPPRFSCTQCLMAFDASWRLQQHILSKHVNYRPHKCDECNKLFLKPADLKNHKEIHAGIKKHACPHCTAKFNNKSNLKRHIYTHTKEKPHVCSGCGNRYQQLTSLKRHSDKCAVKDTQPKPLNRQNHCRVCGLTFQYKSALLEHCVRQHTPSANEEKVAKPTNVDIGKTVDALVDDILSVEDEYSIMNTNTTMTSNNEILNVAVFDESPQLQEEKDNSAENIMQIEFLKEMTQLQPLDDELFYNDIDFDSFQANQVFDINSDYDYGAAIDNNTEIFFDFANSGKTLDQDIMNALYHVKVENLPNDLLDIPEPVTKETNKLEKSVSIESSISVNECATIFERDVDLEESSNLAENLNQLIGENNVQYIATEDDDTFIINLNSAIDAEQLTEMLNIGIEVVDDAEKAVAAKCDIPKKDGDTEAKEKTDEAKVKVKTKVVQKQHLFVCKTCNKMFKKKNNYISHLGTHSLALRLHMCTVCGARFSYRSTLNKHSRAAHVPRVLPAHSCPLCSRQYKAAWLLKNHLERDHYGMAPYGCDMEGCTKKFYKKFDLVIHKRFHLGERPYSCDTCDKTFPHASHLRRHIRSAHDTKHVFHTGKQPYSRDTCDKTFPHALHLRGHIHSAINTKNVNKSKVKRIQNVTSHTADSRRDGINNKKLLKH